MWPSCFYHPEEALRFGVVSCQKYSRFLLLVAPAQGTEESLIAASSAVQCGEGHGDHAAMHAYLVASSCGTCVVLPDLG